jgi:hypothetical protein
MIHWPPFQINDELSPKMKFLYQEGGGYIERTLYIV